MVVWYLDFVLLIFGCYANWGLGVFRFFRVCRFSRVLVFGICVYFFVLGTFGFAGFVYFWCFALCVCGFCECLLFDFDFWCFGYFCCGGLGLSGCCCGLVCV